MIKYHLFIAIFIVSLPVQVLKKMLCFDFDIIYTYPWS